MTKRKLEEFLREYLKDKSLEQQEDLLDKICYKWLPTVRGNFKKRLKKSYIKCPKCKKYFSKRIKLKYVNEKETREGQLVTLNPSYDYDDEFADVTYLVKYYICPLCGRKVEADRAVISEKNRRHRGE